MIQKNVVTDFSSAEVDPVVDGSAYVHPLAAVIGNVIIGKRVMVAPFASVRGDEGQPIHVGDESNVQDSVVLHGLETEHNGHPVKENRVTFDLTDYSVYIGKRVSLAHQVQVHGPALVDDDTFVGMKSLVFRSYVGMNCVVEPGCIIMGVRIADGRYVPAGSVIKDQELADRLPVIDESYALRHMNREVVHVNTALADSYSEREKA